MPSLRGLVKAIHGATVTVEVRPQHACVGCQVQCGASSLAPAMNKITTVDVRVDDPSALAIHEPVTVTITDGTFLKLTAILFVLPVALAILGAALGAVIAPETETAAVGLAVAGLALGGVIMYFVNRWQRAKGASLVSLEPCHHDDHVNAGEVQC